MTTGKILMIAESESANYSLWEIKIKDKVKHAIYAENDKSSDFDLFDANREECKHLFERIVEEELSPIHLADIADDIKRELYETR